MRDSSVESSVLYCYFFFSSRRRHTRWPRDWSSDVCSSDLVGVSFGDAGRMYEVETYEIDGTEYVWGSDVFKLPKIVHTATFSDQRYQTENYRLFVKIVLARVARDIDLTASEQVLISTGVPADQTRENAVKLIKDSFLEGNGDREGLHRVTVEKEEYAINVADVLITSQPLATVLSYYLDEQGLVKDKSIVEKKIAVIDVGGGTTDLDTLLHFNRQQNHVSKPTGFRDVYHDIRNYIKRESEGGNVEINDYHLLHTIEKAERQAKEDDRDPVYMYRISDKTSPVDFTQAYYASLNKIGMAINQFIADQWSDIKQFDRVFLVGGSAKRLAPYIKILDNPDFPKDPGMSNVEGYYNFGVSSAKKAASKK